MGDVEDAICLHAFYYAIWKRYGALPERYNWQLQAPDVLFYPLRPELVESTYLLYQVLRLLSPRPRGGLSSSLLPAAGLCCSVVTLTAPACPRSPHWRFHRNPPGRGLCLRSHSSDLMLCKAELGLTAGLLPRVLGWSTLAPSVFQIHPLPPLFLGGSSCAGGPSLCGNSSDKTVLSLGCEGESGTRLNACSWPMLKT